MYAMHGLFTSVQIWGEEMNNLFERVSESSSANKDTHTHRAYKKAYSWVMDKLVLAGNFDPFSLDLFARMCPWADIRVDINPEFKQKGYTNKCDDALDYAKTQENGLFDIILCDPPFSDRQAKDKYGTSNLYTNPAYISELGKECFRILEPGGYLVKCGYNSNAPEPNLVLVKGYISHYYGCRNDVIVTIWQKQDGILQVL